MVGLIGICVGLKTFFFCWRPNSTKYTKLGSMLLCMYSLRTKSCHLEFLKIGSLRQLRCKHVPCKHYMHLCSNLHAYVDIAYFFIGNLFNLRIFDNLRLMYIILCILTICLGAFNWTKVIPRFFKRPPCPCLRHFRLG